MNPVQIRINELNSVIDYHQKMMDIAKQEQNKLYLILKKAKDNKGVGVLGCGLEDKRIEAGLTAKDLCFLAQISQPAYRSIIKDKVKPRKRTLKKINKALESAGEFNKMKKSNFTLIELLVVIGIIGILVGILLPAISGSNKEAKKTKAKSQVMQIAQACAAYRAEFGTNVISGEVQTDFNDSARIHLRGTDSSGNETNWRKIKFYDSNADVTNSWGNPYYIMCDGDYDGNIQPSFEPLPLGGEVLVWTLTDDGEIIKSWEK